MTVSKEQIRAARAFLDWDRNKLSEESGVSVSQISKFENGETEDPRQSTIRHIEQAFLKSGVVFKDDGGIAPKTDNIVLFEGKDWYLDLLDDVYETLIDRKDAEILFFCADDRKSPPEVNGRLRKMRNAGIRMRQLVEEGNTYLMGPLKEYRYLSKGNFVNDISLVYGGKVAVCTSGNTKAMVFGDAKLAAAWGCLFEELWGHLKQPTRSDAHERF
jgi:transcriptional regulator with XRE-family HTH domain